jgi:hypothetical protein
MNPHFVDLYFYFLAAVLFGTIAFMPRVLNIIGRSSFFKMSPAQLQLLRRINALLCAACVCMALVNVWRLVR